WNKFRVEFQVEQCIQPGEEFNLLVYTINESDGELNCPDNGIPKMSFAWETSPGEWQLEPIKLEYLEECMLPQDGSSNSIIGYLPTECAANEGFILIGDHGLPPAIVSDAIPIAQP
ncbi:MAG: hypothetical protein AAF193_02300, partial [Bacteroidota bacterium]